MQPCKAIFNHPANRLVIQLRETIDCQLKESLWKKINYKIVQWPYGNAQFKFRLYDDLYGLDDKF